jgi:hypothetical protein
MIGTSLPSRDFTSWRLNDFDHHPHHEGEKPTTLSKPKA